MSRGHTAGPHTAGWWVRRTAAGLVGLVALGWVVSLAAVWHAARQDGAASMPGPAAAIIVLGAAQYDGRPSPVLKARLDHAVALWRAGVAPRVIVTGGRRAGDRTTEAATSRRYVEDHGVPDSAVLLENEGQTTDQSLRAAAVLLQQLARTTSAAAGVPASELPPPTRAVLVSDPFHMLRLWVLARRYGITAYGSPTTTSPISAHPRLAWTYLVRESLKVPLTVLLPPSAYDRAN